MFNKMQKDNDNLIKGGGAREDQVLPQGFSGFSFFIQTNGLIDT